MIGLSLLPEAALSAGDSDSSGGEFNAIVDAIIYVIIDMYNGGREVCLSTRILGS